MPRPRKSAFDTPYIEIIDRLIARRHELDMTQTDLGIAFGENQSFISRVERRQRRIDVYEFVRLCRALKLEPGTVLQGIDPEAAGIA
jgi:transcriptional regulator with XRE-family HTH domain